MYSTDTQLMVSRLLHSLDAGATVRTLLVSDGFAGLFEKLDVTS